MKTTRKLLTILVLFIGFCLPSKAQTDVIYFNANAVATKLMDGEWSDWAKSDIIIAMDFDKCTITEYNSNVDVYDIMEVLAVGQKVSGGGEATIFNITTRKDSILGKAGTGGLLRQCIYDDGTHQLYFDFPDISWVYNIKND